MLSSGPGPGSLLAAAGAWNSLSAEYSSAAEELSAILASVEAGAWEGPSAKSYVGAHAPYLAWLTLVSAVTAATATQHETVATAYAAALAAMPTLAELAANHAIHGVLLATNFFGVNTIPIALNEADYVRMWIQAATTMTTYHAVSGTAVASVSQAQQTTPVPQILKSDAQTLAAAASNALQQIEDFLQQIVQVLQPIASLQYDLTYRLLTALGYTWDPGAGTIDGIPYLDYSNPLTLIYWITRALSYGQNFQDFVQALLTNPVQLLQSLEGLTPVQVVSYLVLHPILAGVIGSTPLSAASSAAPAAAVATAAAAAAVDFTAPVDAAIAAAPALVPAAAVSHAVPAAAIGPTVAGTVAAPATAPVSAASAAGAPPAPSAPPAPAAQGFFPYVIAGGPGTGFGSGHTRTATVGAQLRAPAAGIAAASAASAARRRARRRRQTEALREYADAYADLDRADSGDDTDPGPSFGAAASDRGAGPLGFAGTVSKENAQAAGLTVLAGDGFGGGPTTPMVPGTWEPDGAPAGEGG